MAVKTTMGHPATIWSRRQESNLDLSLRRAEFYPLKYSEWERERQPAIIWARHPPLPNRPKFTLLRHHHVSGTARQGTPHNTTPSRWPRFVRYRPDPLDGGDPTAPRRGRIDLAACAIHWPIR
jgi:hypothetical protein